MRFNPFPIEESRTSLVNWRGACSIEKVTDLRLRAPGPGARRSVGHGRRHRHIACIIEFSSVPNAVDAGFSFEVAINISALPIIREGVCSRTGERLHYAQSLPRR